MLESEYQYAPPRIVDMKPGPGRNGKDHLPADRCLDRATGRHLRTTIEMRWPYVFVSAFEDGLQVINIMDPTNPYTVGYYDTYECRTQGGSRRARTLAARCTARRDRGPKRRRPHRDQRPDHRFLGVQDGWLRRLERPSVGHAQHFQRPGLGQRPGGGTQTAKVS